METARKGGSIYREGETAGGEQYSIYEESTGLEGRGDDKEGEAVCIRTEWSREGVGGRKGGSRCG